MNYIYFCLRESKASFHSVCWPKIHLDVNGPSQKQNLVKWNVGFWISF